MWDRWPESNKYSEMTNSEIIKTMEDAKRPFWKFWPSDLHQNAALRELRSRYDEWKIQLSEVSHNWLKHLIDDLSPNEYADFEKSNNLQPGSIWIEKISDYDNDEIAWEYKIAIEKGSNEKILISETWEKWWKWLWIRSFI